MKENKEVKISYWAAHITTIVSVSLVLLIIGIIALISIAASSETRRLRQQIELDIVMADSVSNEQALVLFDKVKRMPYVNSASFISKEQALQNWTADTGEDLEKLFGLNPLSPEIAFTLKADFSSQPQIRKICDSLAKEPGVEGVAAPDSAMVDSMNANIEKLTYILGGIALVLIIISFVLINNTVHLAIHSRRFTIHTMQLVGATNGFIRRPFVLNNLLSGVIACIVASAILAAALAGAQNAGWVDIADYISWPALGIVCAGMLIIGALICSIAALLATTKYLRRDYDELFR